MSKSPVSIDGPPHTGDPADEGPDGCTWYPQGTQIFTLWDHGGEANHFGHCFWVLYYVHLEAGVWRIGLDAINHAAGLPSRRLYPWFQVLVELQGEPRPRLDKAIVYVPASDSRIRRGYEWFRIPRDGWYGIKYTWLNDSSGDDWDANLTIVRVFFDRVPTD